MTRLAVIVTVFVVVVVISCFARPAHADDRAAAEQFYRIGAEAYRAGQFDAAATNFDRAYDQLRAPEIAFSAAQAHRLQYQADRDPAHLARAITLYQAYIDGAPDGARRKDALVYLERLRDALASRAPEPPAAPREHPSLYVSIALDRAQITVDGEPVQRHTTLDVAPGEHVIAATAEGYVPQQQRVTVGQDRAMVAFELAPRPAIVAIDTEPDARVTIDGRPVLLRRGDGGLATEVPPGTRWITVSARGRRPISREVTLSPGQQLRLAAPLQPTAQRRAVRWVVIGAGGLLAAAATTTAIANAPDFSAAELRDQPVLTTGDAARYTELRDRRDRFRVTSVALGGAALVTAAVALVMYYADEPSGDALLRPVEHTSFTPMAFERGAGLGYAGAW